MVHRDQWDHRRLLRCHDRSREDWEVVLLKPRTCLNNFSITPETSEGTPHRARVRGPDPRVKRVTWEATGAIECPTAVCFKKVKITNTLTNAD